MDNKTITFDKESCVFDKADNEGINLWDDIRKSESHDRGGNKV